MYFVCVCVFLVEIIDYKSLFHSRRILAFDPPSYFCLFERTTCRKKKTNAAQKKLIRKNKWGLFDLVVITIIKIQFLLIEFIYTKIMIIIIIMKLCILYK